MVFTEVDGDLFYASKSAYIVHCISADFALGAGIAKKIDYRFNLKQKLQNQYTNRYTFDGEQIIGQALLIENIFSLVTKQKYFHKPLYDTLKLCLIDLRDKCVKLDISELAMPRIGCGLDRLNWNKVKEMVMSTFDNTDVSITVYNYK